MLHRDYAVWPLFALALLLGSLPMAACWAQKEYPIGKAPSDVFVKGVKDALDSGFVSKDTINVFKAYTTIDSSDVGTSILVNYQPFRKARKVWTVILKSTGQFKFPISTINGIRNSTVNPFVGVEEWDFDNTADAVACINMFQTIGSFNGSNFNLHRPPREFVQKGNVIYYFYTYPSDFYPYLDKVRDSFIKYLGEVEVVK